MKKLDLYTLSNNINLPIEKILPICLLLIVISAFIFFKPNLILVLLYVEIIFLSACYNFVIGSNYFLDLNGQVFVLVLLTISAAELAIALSIIVVYYRKLEN